MGCRGGDRLVVGMVRRRLRGRGRKGAEQLRVSGLLLVVGEHAGGLFFGLFLFLFLFLCRLQLRI